jgi:glutathione S-transferase
MRSGGVLDAHLKKSGGEWLVGEKCTYADLAFVPWYWLCPVIMGEGFEKVSCMIRVSGMLFADFETVGMGVEVPD